MYIIQDKGGAIALMIAALCFLGTWPALLNLVERWGRNLMHTYLDYSITNLLVAIIFALTLGQIGSSTPESPNFVTQLHQDNWPSVGFALAGGLVLGVGNLLTQYAWPFVGLSIVEVISSSITVVAGTTMNYFLDDRINRAQILFPGVGCFLIAVFLGAALHTSYSRDNLSKLQAHSRSDAKINTEKSFDLEIMEAPSKSVAQEENGIDKNAKVQTLQANGLGVKAGTGQYLQQLEDQRAMKVVMMILCLVSSPFDLYFVDEKANPKPGSFQAGFLNWFVLLTDIRSENNIWISDCRHCRILLCTFLTCI
jgi:drug/metabolite transporter (DMT)-like permease